MNDISIRKKYLNELKKNPFIYQPTNRLLIFTFILRCFRFANIIGNGFGFGNAEQQQ